MLQEPLTLPCGAVLPNRLAKAAMTERAAGSNHNPNHLHLRLYDLWGRSGAGLLISGNIMTQRRCLESAGNVILTDERALEKFQQWTGRARAHGAHFWAQLSHAGRQTSRPVSNRPVSASSVGLSDWKLYARPRPLRSEEIESTIADFARTAELCQRGGFSGVQIHAAHGYLLSQFLSPITNLREDRWGGSLENRARFLIEVVRAVRLACGPAFPISVKLNSADFQRGGFSEEDSLGVISMLESEGIDLLEISGGNYESPEFMDVNTRESTRQREAYFLDFARRVREHSKLPLMITGGFRSRGFAEATLRNGESDVIGMARPFLVQADFAERFLAGDLQEVTLPKFRVGKAIGLISEGGYYAYQLLRLARGRKPRPQLGPYRAALFVLLHETRKAIGHRLFGWR